MTDTQPSFDPERLLVHRKWIRAIARDLVGDEAQVDDVEQQVYLTAMKRPPRGPIRSLTGWLRRVIRSAVIDEHRSSSSRTAREAQVARPEGVSDTAHLAAQAEAQGIVSSAVAELDEPYRSTVLLRYFEGLPPRAVAQRMGVPVETVRTRLKRAHAQLRTRLDDGFGGDRKAWSIALVALARPNVPLPTAATTAIATATSTAIGITIMTKTTKLGVAAVLALLLLGTATWKLTTDGGESNDAAVVDVAGSDERFRDSQPPPPAAGPPGSLSGVVRSRHDGRPAGGIEVAALHRGKRTTAETDDEGRFVLADLTSNRAWRVSAKAPGFSSGEALDVSVEAAQDVDVGTLWIESATRFVVRVVDPADRPISGARVQLVRKIPEGARADTQSYLRHITDRRDGLVDEGGAETGPDGRAVFDAVPPGRRSVAVFHDDFVQTRTRLPRVQVGMLDLTATVRMTPGHRLAGVVVDADGVPAADAFVYASTGAAEWADDAWVRTDDEGRFVIHRLPAGRCSLSAAYHRRPSRTLANVLVPQVAHVTLRMPATGEVTGTVRDVNGIALAGVDVAVATGNFSGASATSDEQGRYHITDLGAGPIDRFVASHPALRMLSPRTEIGDLVVLDGDVEHRSRALVPAAGVLEVDVILGPGADVSGRVLGPHGPVPDAWVQRRGEKTPAGEEWESTITDAQGRYAFRGLKPGRHLLVVTHESYYQPGVPVAHHEADRAGQLDASHYVQLGVGKELSHDLHVVFAPPVTGRVVDPSGAPLSGVLVTERRQHYGGFEATGTRTDDQGHFEIPHMRPGTGIGFDAILQGHVQSEWVRVDVTPDSPTPPLEIPMVAAPVLRGVVVTDAEQPVPFARVQVRMTSAVRGLSYVPPFILFTDDAGAFQTPLPFPAGDVSLDVVHPDHGRAVYQVAIGREADNEPLRIELGAAGSISGRALHRTDRTPVANALLYVRKPGDNVLYQYGVRYGDAPELAVASTDEQGRFRIDGLDAGPVQLVVTSASVAESFAAVDVPCAAAIEILADRWSSLAGILELAPGVAAASVSVTIVPGEHPPGARPLSDGAGMEQPRDIGRFRRATDAAGRFDFEAIPPGDYTLQVHLAGDRAKTRFGPFAAGNRELRLSLDDPVTATIQGRVLDASGHPLLRASISASPDQDGYHGNVLARTDSAGRFTVEGLTSPVYALTIQGAGIRRLFLGVKVGGPPIDYVLEPGRTLSGSLVDERGAPLAGRNVYARLQPRNPSVMSVYAATDAAGRFELRDLEDATYALALGSEQGTPHARLIDGPVTARAGRDDVRMRATLERRVRGQVLAADGSAIAGLRLQANSKRGGSFVSVRTDSDGRFELTGLVPGMDYTIQPDYGRPEHMQFAWKHRKAIGKTDQDVRLEFPRAPE